MTAFANGGKKGTQLNRVQRGGGGREKNLVKHCPKELIISGKCLPVWNSATGNCAQVQTMRHKLTAVSTATLFACQPPS